MRETPNNEAVTWRPTPGSSWLESIAYLQAAESVRATIPGAGWVLVRTRSGRQYAHLVPHWSFGLLVAAISSGRSVGRVVNRLVYGRQYGDRGVRMEPAR